ncbi:MAG: metallophosphoesterase [Labilithrix sp.]|nr:metallophosphoesterase [Labilithrix sp.]
MAKTLRAIHRLDKRESSFAPSSTGAEDRIVRRIAHLSDVHILDARAGTRRARYRFATKLVNLGQRTLDPHARARRLASALRAAKAQGADHVVISGDLTEVGEDAEFEQFAEVLHDAKLPPESVTLVPGNHDAYTNGDAWAKAMRGPLAAFAAASADAPGKVVDRGRVAFLPIDTTCFQTIAWSGGVFTKETAAVIERRMNDPAFRDKAMVLVVHHPPFHPVKAMKWIDGLRGGANVLDLLARHPRLQLLHGHLHRIFNHILATSNAVGAAVGLRPSTDASGAPTRLFGAPATCDGPDGDDSGGHAPRIRLYDVADGALHALCG